MGAASASANDSASTSSAVSNAATSPKPAKKPALSAPPSNPQDGPSGMPKNDPMESIATAKKYFLLRDVAEELSGQGKPLKLSADTLDLMIASRLSTQSSETEDASLFHYLVGCWKKQRNVKQMFNDLLSKCEESQRSTLQNLINARQPVVEAARQLIVSYSGLVITPGVADGFAQSER
ncbi:hypothetical protein HDU96_008340 [Phlyctochytrium bullatum]|nr:hypothetical protein HDU96_008340 [Phlyctochytrium bullatum]